MEITNAWQGKTAHFVDEKKKCRRCIIKNWAFEKNVIGMNVWYQDRGKWIQRTMSPIHLAAVDAMWHQKDLIVSDDEEDEYDLKVAVPIDRLPNLEEQEFVGISEDIKKTLLWTIKQTNSLLTIV